MITGDAVGQVASQTLENLAVVGSVATLPLFRPLIGMDKEEIMDEARRLGTYPISIIPDQDCCTLFPFWVSALDFNHDGAPDFYVQFAPGSRRLTQDQPLIWLNDGTGHFSTLKVGDFVPPGKEYLIGSDFLMATRNGYTFITMQCFPGRGLEIAGLLASTPYRTTLPIRPGGVIRSDNGQFRLTYQTDGNLVLNDARDGTALWSTATGGTAPGQALMQADGNFVVYGADGGALWSSGTGGNPGAYLWVQDDGGLAVFRADGQTLWSRAQ